MVFSTLFFVFLFFVLSYAMQMPFTSIKSKNIVLLVSSLIFYAWGGPSLVFLLCGMTFICWYGARLIEAHEDKKRKKTVLIVVLVIVLGLLGFFKYLGFAVENLNNLFKASIPIPDIALPIGISFYTFQLLSYVIDVYREQVPAQKKYWLLLLYASLYHQCIAGPIVRYSDINEEILNRKPKLSEISRGVTRFCVGLCKKAFLANAMAKIADTLIPNTPTEAMNAEAILKTLSGASSMTLILGGICFMIQIYLDFSAYSDMAIGMGLMIGFHYKENFNYPYAATSVTDFWRRWHISLSTFFRDYVYIPLGGNRCSTGRQILNLFVVWLLTGLWHGASWNYILWGLYFFVFLVIEKFVFKVKKERHGISAVFGWIFTSIIVLFGWYLFRFEDTAQLAAVIKGIFGGNGNVFADTVFTLALKNNIFLLITAALSTLPIVPAVSKWLNKKSTPAALKKTGYAIEVLSPVVCLVISLIMLVGNSYNPFLYFRF